MMHSKTSLATAVPQSSSTKSMLAQAAIFAAISGDMSLFENAPEVRRVSANLGKSPPKQSRSSKSVKNKRKQKKSARKKNR